MTVDIVEIAARAMNEEDGSHSWEAAHSDDKEWYSNLARSALTAVTPLIEANALERAAKVAEAQIYYPDTLHPLLPQDQIAARIRALKEQP